MIDAFVTRDMNGVATLHLEEPVKHMTYWLSDSWVDIDETMLPEGANPQWTDREAIKVQLKIETV